MVISGALMFTNMNKIIRNLNNVPSELLLWDDPFSGKANKVVICITGNPGVPDFYIDFASELYKILKIPICVVGHAGHVEITDNVFNENSNREHLFTLQAQLKHKMDLLQNHVSQSSEIHLIGHSIGAWMIVELLQNNDQLRERVSSVNLLFPTIQRMAESKNGKFLNNVLRKIHSFILLLMQLLYLIPTCAFKYLIHFYLMIKSLPYKYCDAILKLVKPFVLKNVLEMAFDEMDTVKKLNNDGINKIKHVTNIIYGTHDGWAPLEYMKDLQIYEPYIQMQEAPNIEHAFVLKSSEHIADLVANFIKSVPKRKS